MTIYITLPILRLAGTLASGASGAVRAAGCASKAYVVNSGSASVSVIDMAAQRVTSTIAVDKHPVNPTFTPDRSRLYVANSTEIVHLSASNPDGKADKRRVVLSGFGPEATDHRTPTFRWGQDRRSSCQQ